MRIIKINSLGQFVRENGDFVWLSGTDAVKQLIRQFIQTFKGEVFLDITDGVDYKTKIFPKDASDFSRYTEFKRTILKVPGVKDIIDMEFSVVNAAKREYRVKINVQGTEETFLFDEVI